MKLMMMEIMWAIYDIPFVDVDIVVDGDGFWICFSKINERSKEERVREKLMIFCFRYFTFIYILIQNEVVLFLKYVLRIRQILKH